MPRSTTQRIGADIRALERHLASLRQMKAELTASVVVMGPGNPGRDALAAYGGDAELAQLIRSYEMAISDLGRDCERAEIAEQLTAVRRACGAQRAVRRACLREMIAAHRDLPIMEPVARRPAPPLGSGHSHAADFPGLG